LFPLFATGVANLLPVSLIPVGKLPPVLIPVATTLGKMVEKSAAGVIDTDGKFATLTCEYIRKFLKKFKTVLMDYSGGEGN
jgi:hypothetical protein